MEIKDIIDIAQITVVPMLGLIYKLVIDYKKEIKKEIEELKEKLEQMEINNQKNFIEKDEVLKLIDLHLKLIRNAKGLADK